MLPSILQPLASLASSPPAAADSLLPGTLRAATGLVTGADVLSTARGTEAFVLSRAKTAPRAAPAGPARPKPSGAGYATTPTSTSAAKPGPLAFLSDKNLSIEEKLMRLLSYLSDKWDKEMDKKMKEIGGQGAASSGSASGSTKPSGGGGILDGLGAIVKTATQFFPAVGITMAALQNPTVRAVLAQVSGPVLAAGASAVGFPELAPALLKYGPQIVDLAAGVATSLTAAAPQSSPSPSTSTASSSSSASSSGAAMNDNEIRMKLMEIERLQNLQKEMFALVSNILKSGHDARMSVIQNVR